jgi:hypothetical protein
MGPSPCQLPRGRWPVKMFDRSWSSSPEYCRRRRRRSRSLGDKLRYDSGLECYHEPFGGGAPPKSSPELLWWTSTAAAVGVCDASELRQPLWRNKMLRTQEISPGCFPGACRRQSWPEATSTSPILAGLLQRGTTKIRWLRMNWSDSSGQDASSIEAELWEYSAMLRVVSIDGEEARPELGFQFWEKTRDRRSNGASRSYPRRQKGFYSRRSAAAPSGTSRRRRQIERWRLSHAAASWREEDDDPLPKW